MLLMYLLVRSIRDYAASYTGGTTSWKYGVTFTGLDPEKTYEFATTANRGGGYGPGKTDSSRWSKFVIDTTGEYTNESSVAAIAGEGIEIVDDATTLLCGGENTDNGYIVKWSVTGADSFTVTSSNVGAAGPGNSLKGYGMQAFMLHEVPEPASLALFGLGGLALLRRKH